MAVTQIGQAIEDITNNIRDWFTGIYDSVNAWITEQTDKLRLWIAETAADIKANLTIWRHKATIALADWFNSTFGFWLSIYAAVAVISTIIIAGAAGQLPALIEAVSTPIKVIESVVKEMVGKLNLDLLMTINDVLISLIPQYRAVWQDLYTAIGGIAEELSLGVGTIANTMRNIEMTITSALMLAGLPEESASIQYFLNSADTYERIEENFETYARNPQQIFEDLRTWILVPSLENIGEFREGVDDSLGEFNEKLQTFSGHLIDFNDNLTLTVEELPDEIEEVVNNRIGPFITNMNVFVEEQVIPFTEKVDEIDGILDDFIEREERRAVWLDEYINNKFNNILQWNNLTSDDKQLLRVKILQAIRAGDLKITNIGAENFENYTDGMIKAKMNYLSNDEEIKAIKMLNVRATVKPPEYKTKVVGWFRGEY